MCTCGERSTKAWVSSQDGHPGRKLILPSLVATSYHEPLANPHWDFCCCDLVYVVYMHLQSRWVLVCSCAVMANKNVVTENVHHLFPSLYSFFSDLRGLARKVFHLEICTHSVILCPLNRCGSLLLITIDCKKAVLWLGMRDAQICGITQWAVYSYVYLILGSPLWPMM